MPTEADQGLKTALPPSAFARLATAARYAITGVAPTSWFGPQQPLAPMAPAEVKGRQFDYPFGINIDYTPRSTNAIGFAELRALADSLPLLRAVIETRKDQIAATSFAVRLRDPAGDAAAAAQRIRGVRAFLDRPDRRHSFASWLRMLLEDMLVIDAATIYPRLNRAGALYSLDIIDGATITPLVGEDGRSPEPPDPAYQQILHGIPAADFSSDELLYLKRNARAHRLYGMSPVEQIALTVNIALRRDALTLDYYRAGSAPDSFATLPKEWTMDQIGQFQDYFDALMAGNSARRRMIKFMPADFHLQETRQPPLKDQYDEWLARIVCYAFSVPVSPFVSSVNRATGETLRVQANQEGLIPLRAWIKDALDRVIQTYLGEDDLEFVWVGDDAVDPLQQAQTLQILVGAGIKTKDEARAELGLAPEPAGGAPAVAAGLGKFNPHHDPRNGQFTTVDGAGDGHKDVAARSSPDFLTPMLVADDVAGTTPGGFKFSRKNLLRMNARGWTPEQIDEAVRSGYNIEAINKDTGGAATRYIHPSTKRSVVIDDSTNEVIHAGGDGFEYGPKSGDRAGAVLRPPRGGGGGGGAGGGGEAGSGFDGISPRSRKIPFQYRPSD